MYSMFKKTLQSSIVMYSAFLKPQLEAQETRWGGYMPLPLYRINPIPLNATICRLLSELFVNYCETLGDPY